MLAVEMLEDGTVRGDIHGVSSLPNVEQTLELAQTTDCQQGGIVLMLMIAAL